MIRRAASRAEPPRTESEDAWRILGLVSGWVTHAEAKAGASMAAAGIIGGLLFAVVQHAPRYSAELQVCMITCAVLVGGSFACAGAAVLPRLRGQSRPASLLFFGHIARSYEGQSDRYAQSVRELITEPDDLIGEIARETWAIAGIAQAKYRWVCYALVTTLLSLIPLAIATILVLRQR